MHLVFIMDPVGRVLVDEDTSFALMLQAQAQGHRVDHCLVQDLFVRGGNAWARVRPARMQRDARAPITLGEAQDLRLHDVDAVLVRKDPPFDASYLWCTHLLELVRGDTLVVNDPRGLRDANEKLYACHFPEVMPETLVSTHRDRIRRFVAEVGGRAVIKPLDGAGGEGVMSLSEGDPNLRAIIDATTHNGQRLAMVQRFLPAYVDGDKRVLLLDGEPLGAILRVPQKGDIASNIHMGGRVEKSGVDAHDRRIIDAVAPRLSRDGLWFVGLDVIGGKLTEVNVTSPTGIQQMSRLDGGNLEKRVIDWIAGKTGA